MSAHYKIQSIPSLAAPSSYSDSRNSRQQSTSSQSPSTTDSKSSENKFTTLYIGNLSFYTTEEQIYALFSRCCKSRNSPGIRRIIMGLDRIERRPCGFCFVEFYSPQEAEYAMLFISGTKLDDRLIRCDLDPQGFIEGRQYGRGKSGGQVRDEHRSEYDPGRGGWGHREAAMRALYSSQASIPQGASESAASLHDNSPNSKAKRPRDTQGDELQDGANSSTEPISMRARMNL